MVPRRPGAVGKGARQHVVCRERGRESSACDEEMLGGVALDDVTCISDIVRGSRVDNGRWRGQGGGCRRARRVPRREKEPLLQA